MDVSLILGVVGPVVTIVTILGTTLYWLGGKFKEIEMRFKEINEHFRQIDERFKQIDKRFEEIDGRFREIDKKFEKVDDRFDRLERDLKGYVDTRFGDLKGYVDSRINELKGYVDSKLIEFRNYVDGRFNRLVNIITGQNEFITEFLGFRGVLDSKDVSFVKAALHSMVVAATNPPTEAEKRRLLELIDKDELTLEEADELLQLARKFVMEYGDRGPDVWKMLWYASVMHGITLRKLEEKKSKEGQGRSPSG
ncbi:hypothetical protein [Vulcanisaeta souniana]|uniref:PaREP5ab n=1 Tax=Vulcanisaeta souniana JCM 11219 TaxID=1293586 RepID=A0A830EAZ4_9CREN|nr:hypothetical protein [Vulcanisaeta souniana]BDR92833.1 hypothetical protein Vsou_19260 [Vulcanisaeta souniana JCM 11219]GGI81805.1 hypothetical protein GCM10007112_18140 [Vulcanisaeta souniana JCM 11219]